MPEIVSSGKLSNHGWNASWEMPGHGRGGDGRASGGGPRFQVEFYKGKYAPSLGSIIPVQDIQPLVPRDVTCIVLEEPEHLTWYHSGKRWVRAFPKYVPVVGVMHTNYVDYAKRMAGETAAMTLKRLNTFLCRQHTHKVVKLSDAVQKLPREETCFVHGVSEKFLQVGRSFAESKSEKTFTKGAYFLGKALWAKGFEELLDRLSEHAAYCEQQKLEVAPVDVYGQGKELDDIQMEAKERNLSIFFCGTKDHISPDMSEYRMFLNPSTSDVVATTSAEALAMGKWLLVPRHPCNEFFESFRNCMVYENAEQFSEMFCFCSQNDPQALSEDEIYRLSWESATDRFLLCCSDAEVERSKPLGFERVACKTSWFGYNIGYNVYSIVDKAIESVQKAFLNNQNKRRYN